MQNKSISYKLQLLCFILFYCIILYYIDINNILSTKLKHYIPSTFKTSTRLTFLFFYSCTLLLDTIQDDKRYISHQIFQSNHFFFGFNFFPFVLFYLPSSPTRSSYTTIRTDITTENIIINNCSP